MATPTFQLTTDRLRARQDADLPEADERRWCNASSAHPTQAVDPWLAVAELAKNAWARRVAARTLAPTRRASEKQDKVDHGSSLTGRAATDVVDCRR
jgi:hypothetical protein